MRVITGLYKGRRIQAPANNSVRPTTDFAKTGLFNILEHQLRIDWPLQKTLDLFAGFGGISLELLSRGVPSNHVFINDLQAQNIAVIKKNFERVGVPAGIHYSQKDALQLLDSLANNQQFGFIFIDPPYQYPHYRAIIEKIWTNNLLLPDGLLVVEHGKEEEFAQMRNYTQTRHYGKVLFSFFEPTSL